LLGAAEVDGGLGLAAAVLKEGEAVVFFFQDTGLCAADVAGEEEGLGVADAEGLEGLVMTEEVEVKVGEGDFGIEVEAGAELVVGEELAGLAAEGVLEGGEGVALDGEAGGHLVTAEFYEVLGAGGEGFDQGEAFDAAAAAFAEAGVVETDDEGGAVVGFAEAGGDDAEDAGVPAIASYDDGGVVWEVLFFHDEEGLVVDGFFDFLAFAVLAGEGVGEGAGAGVVVGEEELEGLLGAGEAACGVDAGAELEADVGWGEGWGDAGGVDEGADASPAGFFQLEEAALDEDAVLAAEGDDVGYGAEGCDVEVVAEIEVWGGALFEEGVAGFEDDAYAAEVVEVWAELGVDEREAGGLLAFGLVVVEDEDVDVLSAEGGDLGYGAGAAVEGEEELGLMGGDAAGEALWAEAVAFVHAEGEEGVGVGAEAAEDAGEEG
jgi:hypothetical protein